MDALSLYANSLAGTSNTNGGAAPAPAPAPAAPADALSLYADSLGAPAQEGGKSSDRVAGFVQQYRPLAERISKATGVGADALLGQWGLETGWGKSVIPGTNNLGNIKDFSGKGPQAADNMTGSRDAYRKYDSAEQFGDDFAGLLTRRYKSAMGSGDNAERYFTALKAGGYAEDPDYVRKGVEATKMVSGAGGAARSADRSSAFVGAREQQLPERNVFGLVNDTVIDIANAATGLMKAGVDLFAPSSAVSEFLGARITEGKASQSDLKKAYDQQLADNLAALGDHDGTTQGAISAELSKAGAQLVHSLTVDPAGTVGMILGNIGPFAVLGRGMQAARLGEASRMAVAGAVSGTLMAGGVRGSIWERISQTPDAELQAKSPEYAQLRQTMSEEEAKAEVGRSLSRNAPELAVAFGVGLLGGRYGLEGIAARTAPVGMGRAAAAAAGGVTEVTQGATEQVAGNVGVQRVDPTQSLIEDVGPAAIQEGLAGVAAGGAFGGGHGAAPAAPAPAPRDPIAELQQAAAQPDSPLTRAAVANPAAAAAAIQAQATQAAAQQQALQAQQDQEQAAVAEQQQAEAEAAQPKADPIGERAREIGQAIRDSGALETMRAEGSQIDVKSLLKDLATAQSPSTSPAVREQALGRIEYALDWAGVDLKARPAPAAAPEPAPQVDPVIAAMSNPQVSDADKATLRSNYQTALNAKLPEATRQQALAAAREIAGRYMAPAARPAAEAQTPVVLGEIEGSPASAASEAQRLETGAKQFQEEGFDDEAAELQAQADSLRERIATERAGEPEGDPEAILDAEEAAAPRALPEARTTPAGDGPAFLRRRRAAVQQLVANGFDRVERGEDGFVLRNSKTNQSFKLDGPADAQMARKALADNIAARAGETNTAPTDGQKEAGNYKKGRIEYDGLKIAIENPVGSERTGTAPDGTTWRTPMNLAHYGYVQSTEAADGDQVDVYVAKEPRLGAPAFVIDQYNDDGSFDESKTILGVATEAEATRIYDAGFSDGSGPRRRAAVTQMPIDEFRDWAMSPAAKKPAGPAPEKKAAAPAPASPASSKTVAAPAPSPSEGDMVVMVNGASVTIKLTEIEGSPEADVMREVAKIFGKKIQFFADSSGAVGDGFVMPGDSSTIYLNESSGISPLAVFGHELTHQLKAENPEAAAAIDAVVAARLKEGATEKMVALSYKQGEALEEITADIGGDLMTDATFWKEVFDEIQAKHGKKAQGIIARLTALVYKAMERFVNIPGAKTFGSENLVTDMNAIRAAYRTAIADYLAAQGVRQQAFAAEVTKAQQAGKKKRAEAKRSAARDVTETPEFKRWFGDSKVVDADGRPLVVYHGTDKDVVEFDPSRSIFDDGSMFFSSSPQTAFQYAKSSAGKMRRGANTIPVYLALRNPLVVDFAGGRDLDGLMDAREEALSDGRDGVVALNVNDGYGIATQYVAFRPEQIKSAIGNRGTFDPADADITRSAARPAGIERTAYHFSQAARTSLDGRKYGTGMRGGESRRLERATDPRIKQRVYAYLDENKAPEDGVGGVKHEVKLANLYDAKADKLGLWKADANASESAILDAGYDGYFVDGVAVVMGDASHSIAAKPLNAEPREDRVRRALMASEIQAFNPSVVPGARMRAGIVEFPASSLEQANAEMERIGSPIRFSKSRIETTKNEVAAIEARYRDTDAWMKAPNGQPTKLTERQWLHVRTPSFKRWFGDWEQFAGPGRSIWDDTNNTVSRAIDANGEPLVVYHGTDKGGFAEFERPTGERRGNLGIFLSPNWEMARSYVRRNRLQDSTISEEDIGDETVSGIYALFLNIRNPEEAHFEGANWDGSRNEQWEVFVGGEKQYDQDGYGFFSRDKAEELAKTFVAPEDAELDPDAYREFIQPAEEHYESTDSVARKARSMKMDGAHIHQVVDDGGGPSSYSGEPSDIFVAFDPNQVKSADFNAGTYSVSDDDIRRAAPRSTENRHGFWPDLLDRAKGKIALPPKALFTQETNNKNAARQVEAIDAVLRKFPAPEASVNDWNRMMAFALADRQVPIAPYQLINRIESDAYGDIIGGLSDGQVADADHGFANAAAFRELYASGDADVVTTGKLALWSFLSRGVSPYVQESLFMDAITGIEPWVQRAADGSFDEATQAEYLRWANGIAPAGSGQPGSGSKHNLNAFGTSFLAGMAKRGEDGRTHLQRLHDLIADPKVSGPEIRREFVKFGEGVGIDNKVVSFTLLVSGRDDVMVLDRVQIRGLWDDGRFAGVNLYDGVVGENKQIVNGSSLATLTSGARGLLVYEAIERAIGRNLKAYYEAAGRPEAASLGRFHWETWVAYSGQEASHGTIDGLMRETAGRPQPYQGITAKEGEYGSFAYGARYGVDSLGQPYFLYENSNGQAFRFDVPSFREMLATIKKPASKVVPTKFLVSKDEDGNNRTTPWREDPRVDRGALDRIIAKFGSPEQGERPVPQDATNDATAGAGRRSVQRSAARDGGRQQLRPEEALPGAPRVEGATGPDPRLVAVAEAYARKVGIDLRRQGEYAQVDEGRARRLAAAYEAMEHAPQDPKVKAAYEDLARQTRAQFDALTEAGYTFYFADQDRDPYEGNPWGAMRDLRANQRLAVFPTAAGFGSDASFDPAENPLLADTGLTWGYGSPDGQPMRVLANDLFRAVHDAFGHGLEGAGFRAQGEENAWQAHVRLFTGPAVGAITSETRGQNSWLNFGPNAERNQTAKVEETVFADQKTGLLPEWAWTEGRVGDMEAQRSAARGVTDTEAFKRWFGDSKAVDRNGDPLVVYHGTGADFTVFDRARGGETTRAPNAKLGHFFVNRPDVAAVYARMSGGDQTIVPAYLSLQNPLRLQADNMYEADRMLLKQLKDEHDGAILSVRTAMGEGGRQLVYMVRESSQVKSATGNRGTFDPADADITRSVPRPQFYSQLQRVIEQVPDRLANQAAPQWKLWLDANAPKLGVKKEEIEWSGIKDWLDLQGKMGGRSIEADLIEDGRMLSPAERKRIAANPGKVSSKLSKADLVAYLDDSGVRVSETVLGEASPYMQFGDDDIRDASEFLREHTGLSKLEFDEEYDGWDDADIIESANEFYREAYPDSAVPTKYEGYTAPGGTNYREVLITLPEREPDFSVDDFIDKMVEKYGRDAMYTVNGNISTLRPDFEERLSVKDREEFARVRAGQRKPSPRFKSNHWDQENILAHLRVDDRVDADGHKVLFINEVQSDWAQGRRKNLAMAANSSSALVRAGAEKKTPRAPFIEDTKAWVGLALKRAIMMAVDGGYDRVALINGQQAADLYDLSKQIGMVRFDGGSSGGIGPGNPDAKTGVLYAYDLRGNLVFDRHVDNEEAIADLVGKEVAARLLEQPGSQARSSGGTGIVRRELKGLDLKVGGDGMRAFYDEIVPQVASDVLKKLGGGKVSTIEVPAHRESISGGQEYTYSTMTTLGSNEHFVVRRDNDEEVAGPFGTHAEASAWLRANDPATRNVLQSRGFDITPEMREKVQAGVPLFSKARQGAWFDDATPRQQTALEGMETIQAFEGLDFRAVSGLVDSAGATYNDFEIAPRVRRIPAADLDLSGYDNARDAARIRRLADEIQESGEIEPLIFAMEPDGQMWLLEGQHRARALTRHLGFNTLPGRVVVSMDGTEGDYDVEPSPQATAPTDYRQSEGQMPLFSRRRDITDSTAFKKWFGDSKVVGEDGQPLVVYHGTTADFSAFDVERIQRKAAGAGFYFTSDREQRGYSEGDGANVMPVYLSIKNPTDNPYLFRTDVSYDGLIFPLKSSPGVTHFAVRRPEQIKSATGNDGGFDPDNADITRSTGRTATGAAWESPSVSKWDDLVYKLQDKQVETKRVVDAIKAASGSISDDMDVYLKERLFHGRAAKRTQDFVDNELSPLIEEMRKQGLEIADLEEYLHARHAEEANDVIAQRNPNIPDGGSGMKTQDARNYMAALPAADKAALDAAAKKVDAILRKTKQLYVDYELESASTVAGWGSMFKHYVPLMREDKEGTPGTGQGISIKGKEVKGRTGSTRKVVDILANIALQRERAIVRGEKNRVSRALIDLAADNENPDFWTVDQVPSEQVFNPSTGLVETRYDPLWKSRENTVVAKIADSNGIVREHAVVFNEEDPRALRMAQSLKNLDAAQLEGLIGVSAKITRYFASVNTQWSPIFGVVNLVRDVQAAMLGLSSTELKGKQKEVAGHTLSALRGIYADVRAARQGKQPSSKWATLWDEFQQVGGQTGYRDLFRTSADRTDAIQKALDPTKWMDSKLGKVFTAGGLLKVPLASAQKQVGWLFDWLSDYNETLENGVRLAAYRTALDQGMSKERAAALAKNLTVDFNKKGQVAQQAGAMYAFFNAAIQGTARIGQVLFDMDPGKPKTLRLSKTGKKVVYGGMLLGSIQALALAAAGFNDEDPPEFSRERNLIIPTGGKTYISIPMPLGFHVIPSIGRITTEFALSGFTKPHERALSLFSILADAFNPIGNAGLSMQTLAPTALDPFVALTENRDWTGRPIARESFNKATPGHALGRDTATAVAEVTSQAINALTGGNKYVAGVFSPTPDQVDYLLGQVTGGVGRELSKTEQTLKAIYRGETMPPYKVPLFGRFVGVAKGQASEGSSFYANVDKLNRLETEIKGLREDGRTEEANAMQSRNRESYLIARANAAERQVQRLRREKSELIKSGAPRAQVIAIESKITDTMKRLNDAMAERATAE